MNANEIPLITDPMGEYWDQPNPQDILIDEAVAIMTQEVFDKLQDYSHTVPTGTYAGKMWRTRELGGWILRWYGENDGKFITVNKREIIVV